MDFGRTKQQNKETIKLKIKVIHVYAV